jgi:hypothetical protein
MPEYIANLMEARQAYISFATTEGDNPELAAVRGRAFDRMIREIQDESHEDGYNQRGWEDE